VSYTEGKREGGRGFVRVLVSALVSLKRKELLSFSKRGRGSETPLEKENPFSSISLKTKGKLILPLEGRTSGGFLSFPQRRVQ